MANPFNFGGGVNSVPQQPAQDWQLQSQGLNRKRALMDALMAQNMSPTPIQQVSGRVVNNGALDGFSKIAMALALKGGYDKADKQQSEIQQGALARHMQARAAMQGAGAPKDIADIQSRAAAAQGIDPSFNPWSDEGFKTWLDIFKQNEIEKGKGETYGDIKFDEQGAYRPGNKGGTLRVPNVGRDRKMQNVNGVYVDENAATPGQVAPQDPNKPFGLGPDGKAAPNTPYQNYELSKAEKSAPKNTITLGENKFAEAIGTEVGKRVSSRSQEAEGAVGTIERVNGIRDALATGKVMAGPGANAEIVLSQVGSRLGFNNATALAETRKAIQGMAGLELQAAEQMKGQGQITEAERGLIKRASAGDITMTIPEIEAAINATEKVARLKIRANSNAVQKIKSNPNMQSTPVELLDVPEPPSKIPGRRVRNPQTGEILEEQNGKWVKVN